MCSEQNKEGIPITSSEIEGSHEFQTNCLREYVFTGIGEDEVEQEKRIPKEVEMKEENTYACDKQ
jgi:hypothetical protein